VSIEQQSPKTTSPDVSSSSSPSTLLTPADYLRKILLAPVHEVAKVTALSPMNKLSGRLNNHVWLKREDTQPVHSFKLRGAYNKLASLTQAEKEVGVVAASAGNHAQGVALSAQHLGINARIVMPKTTPEIKVSAVRGWGAEVILHGETFDEASVESRRLATEFGYTQVHPFDDPDVIAGQGTIAGELLQQLHDIDTVFIPVGGGGLLAGMSVYLKQLRPEIRIVGVEAEEAAGFNAAMEAGELVTLDEVGLFADGCAVKRMGEETFRLCQQYTDEVVTVTNDQICAAIKDIFEDTRAIAEPAGALALAGLKKYQQSKQPKNKNLVAILSGANTNFHTLRYISERCELGEQREALLAVQIPEQKGSFKHLCGVLGKRSITEFNYRYTNADKAHVFIGVQLRDGQEELAIIKQELASAGYDTHDYSNNELAKLHVRYMLGGSPQGLKNERLFDFEIPEVAGALMHFLELLGEKWNISLFHFRNHGASVGLALAAFEVPEEERVIFREHLNKLGYQHTEETDNPAYLTFLASKG
jgi:threonine dehydratase